MFPIYHVFPIVLGMWGDLYTPYILGASLYLSGFSVSVSTSICLLIHNNHTSCSPALWDASLLDWMPMEACYASCYCSFLCSVFIMSQVSTTIAMTATPPVTVVSSGTSSLLSTVTMASSLVGLPATLGQHDVVLLPPLKQGTLEVLLALPLCHSSKLCLRCLFRFMLIMQWFLHR